MTYGQFLALFLGLPLLGLAMASRFWLDRRLALTLLGVAALAVIYTGPWDEAIIRNGVWSYGPG
ncbi:MAG: lycopene cyclase domain-containing protein, partial [Chloroflexota bacterium]|nr:lycopene cyclase domain-containing protein [Chloroflexota bacterium]